MPSQPVRPLFLGTLPLNLAASPIGCQNSESAHHVPWPPDTGKGTPEQQESQIPTRAVVWVVARQRVVITVRCRELRWAPQTPTSMWTVNGPGPG